MGAGAAERDGREDACHHGHSPCRCDDDPPGVFTFRFLQENIRNGAIAQQDQHQRAREFAKKWSIHRVWTSFLF